MQRTQEKFENFEKKITILIIKNSLVGVNPKRKWAFLKVKKREKWSREITLN